MAKAYLEITLEVDDTDRSNAAGVYSQYKAAFIDTIKGALSKELLVHAQDIQILHSFDSVESAREYLMSDLFNNAVVLALKPHLKGQPDIKIYAVA